MRILTAAEYDFYEQIALKDLPARVIQAFRPTMFTRCGYPSRVMLQSEIVKFVDSMQEGLFEARYREILGGGISPAEFDLWQRLLGVMCNFTEEWFGRIILPRSTVVHAINVLRHIKYLYADDRPRVFEFGPGSGYLSALLLLENCPYASTDVCQGMYLYQNNLLSYLSKGRFYDGVLVADVIPLLRTIQQGTGVHIPWWQFCKLVPDSVPTFDVVTCNQMLCEMDPLLLRFNLIIARAFLRGEGKKIFIFEGWGDSGCQNRAGVTQLFYAFGFRLVHHDRCIAVFVPDENVFADDCLKLPKTNLWTKDSNLARQTGGDETCDSAWAPEYYQSKRNPLSQAILVERARLRELQTIPYTQIVTLCTAILRSSDHANDDEKFLNLLRLEGGVGDVQ